MREATEMLWHLIAPLLVLSRVEKLMRAHPRARGLAFTFLAAGLVYHGERAAERFIVQRRRRRWLTTHR